MLSKLPLDHERTACTFHATTACNRIDIRTEQSLYGFINFLRITFTFAAGLMASADAYAGSLVCESRDHTTSHCFADTSNGVTLSVQLSKPSCRQGSTWGTDRRGVWVSNGCRVQFETGTYRSSNRHDNGDRAVAALAIGLIGAAIINSKDRDNHDYRYDNSRPPSRQSYVTCESQDDRVQHCAMPLRNSRVDISRQLSRSPCTYTRSWGYDHRGIGVSDGCRAEFAVY